MRIRSLLMGPAGLMVLAAFSFALGVTAAFTPGTVDIVLAGTGALVILAAAVYAVSRVRSLLVTSLILLIALDAALIGNCVPYKLEMGDLSLAQYGSDDMPGTGALAVKLFVISPIAVGIGPLVFLLASIVLWLPGRRLAS